MNRRGAAVFTAVVFSVGSVGVAGQELVELEPGLTAERGLGPGESHRYTASLDAGTVLRVFADQRGIDVVLRLYGPDGAKIRDFDGPTGDSGSDELSFVAEAAGTYVVEIAPLGSPASGGKYQIRVADLRPATPEESAAAATAKVVAVLERQWDDAVRTRDLNAIERLMAEDFTSLASSGGMNSTRGQTRQNFADGAARLKGTVSAHELTDTNVQIAGDSAIATGHATITTKTEGRESTMGGRFTHVWQKRAGGWRVVADHFDSEGSAPPPVKPVAMSPAALDALTGTYDLGTAILPALTVSRAGDGLGFKNEWGWADTFLPASSTEFFGKSDSDARALFVRDDAGRVVEVVLISSGQATRARRLDPGP